MSPTMRAVPAMHPSQFARRFRGEIGKTSAMGFPKRVTRIGLRVLRTWFKMSRQFALNSDMQTSFTRLPYPSYAILEDLGCIYPTKL